MQSEQKTPVANTNKQPLWVSLLILLGGVIFCVILIMILYYTTRNKNYSRK